MCSSTHCWLGQGLQHTDSNQHPHDGKINIYKWTQWPNKQYSWLNMHQAAISVNKDHCTGVIGRFIPWQFLPILASRDWVTWVVLSAAILTSMRIICQHQLSVHPRRLHILSEYSAKCQHFDAHRPHIFPFESKHMNNQCRTASCQAEFARRATDRTATSRPLPGKCLQRAGGPAGRAARTAAGLMVSKIWSGTILTSMYITHNIRNIQHI